MKESVRIALLLVLFSFLASCSVDGSEELSTSGIGDLPSAQCHLFGRALHEYAEVCSQDSEMLSSISDYVYARDLRSVDSIPGVDVSKLEAYLSDLVELSDGFLEAFGIKDVREYSAGDKLVLCTLLYADYMDQHTPTSRLRGGGITDNHYVDCALSALGIREITQLATDGVGAFVKRYGAKALLKSVAKVAGKSLSWVGWGLAAYDFVTCL